MKRVNTDWSLKAAFSTSTSKKRIDESSLCLVVISNPLQEPPGFEGRMLTFFSQQMMSLLSNTLKTLSSTTDQKC